MKKQNGFSLIELLIVVVILGIIAAIAIPNLLASRRAANEGSAIASMRVYHSAQMTYQSTKGAGNFAGVYASANAFPILNLEGIMDSVLGSGIKSGYTFVGYGLPGSAGSPATFFGMAVPTTSSSGGLPIMGFVQSPITDMMATGNRYFAINTGGELHHDHVANLHSGMEIQTDENGGYVIRNGTPIDLPVYPRSQE